MGVQHSVQKVEFLSKNSLLSKTRKFKDLTFFTIENRQFWPKIPIDKFSRFFFNLNIWTKIDFWNTVWGFLMPKNAPWRKRSMAFSKAINMYLIWKKGFFVPLQQYLFAILTKSQWSPMTNSQVHMEYLTVFENQPKCLIWIFEIWCFPPIFVFSKLTCLVTLFDRELQV